jgi:hypothetical protein
LVICDWWSLVGARLPNDHTVVAKPTLCSVRAVRIADAFAEPLSGGFHASSAIELPMGFSEVTQQRIAQSFPCARGVY